MYTKIISSSILHESLAFLKFDLCLICSQCDHGSGARDVAKQEWKQVEVTDPKETDYITAYGTKHDAEKSGYAAAYNTKQDAKDSGYAAAYSTKQYAKDSSYVAAYGTQQDVEESGYAAGYKAAYRTKQDVKDSYITSYNTKEDSTEHVSVRFMICFTFYFKAFTSLKFI